ncbi:MAG: hypothetical protein M3N68_01625, partial [Actinomycetota bacterium]|nr:hypothetical protein [Actinomycetota bacterium]
MAQRGRVLPEVPGARPRPVAAEVDQPPRLVAQLKQLAVQPEVVGPHARLGLVWAIVTFAALFAGPLWLAAWLAPVAAVGAIQAAASWRRRSRRPAA